MGWFHTNEVVVDRRDQASVLEVLACFRDERSLLFRLALLITSDEATANQSVVNACETTVQGHSPFRDWLTEWAKAATITSAICRCIAAIRSCEAAYKDLRCSHSEHLSQGDDAEREHRLSVVLSTDPRVVIAELDPLARAVLVLRLALRSSIQDCVLRLNVSRAAILAANCHAMTWLRELQLKRVAAVQQSSSAEAQSGSDHSRRSDKDTSESVTAAEEESSTGK
ncbi:MAG: hypothetical protein LAO30_06020 [Acidobacteriia bacterium]|nr:hypothetical protein [Terriglobia bacterium]